MTRNSSHKISSSPLQTEHADECPRSSPRPEIPPVSATPSPRSKPNIGKKRIVFGRGYDMTSALTTSPARASHVDGLRKMYRDAGTMLSSLGSLGDVSNIDGEQCNRNRMCMGKNGHLNATHGHEYKTIEDRSTVADDEVETKIKNEPNIDTDNHKSTVRYPSLTPLTDVELALDCNNNPSANGSPHRHVHNYQNFIPTPARKMPQMMTLEKLSRPGSSSAEQPNGKAISSHQDQKPNRATSGHTASECISTTPRTNITYRGNSISAPSPSKLVCNHIPATGESPRLFIRQFPSASPLMPPRLLQTSTNYPIYSNPPTPNTPRNRFSRASRFTVVANAELNRLTHESPRSFYTDKNYADWEKGKTVMRERGAGEEAEGNRKEKEEEEEEEEEEEALRELSPNVKIYRKGKTKRKDRRRIFEGEEEKRGSWVDREVECDDFFGTPAGNIDKRESLRCQ